MYSIPIAYDDGGLSVTSPNWGIDHKEHSETKRVALIRSMEEQQEDELNSPNKKHSGRIGRQEGQ